MLRIIVYVLTFLLLFTGISRAQYLENYSPKNTYTEHSKVLIKQIQKQLDSEIKDVGSIKAQKIFRTSTEYLIKLIKQDVFLNDYTIQLYVQEVFESLLLANNIVSSGKTILVGKNPDINAVCFGEGTFLITIGLLRKIENKAQLAFTLAHELAHYELGHVKQKVIQLTEKKNQKIVDKEVDRIINGTVTTEGLEKLRSLTYTKNRFSRELELAADSLGFVFYKKAGYNVSESVKLIDQLNFSNYSKYNLGEKLFFPFHFRKFPFQQNWLNDRLGIYNKETKKYLLFHSDSIQSHPDFELRKTKLKAYLGSDSVVDSDYDAMTKLVIKSAELEAIESAFFLEKLDLAMFLALEIKPVYPQNQFINTKIVQILLALYEAHENRELDYYVPNFTSSYHEDLRKVNNFLHNTSKNELMEMAFHFMNQKTNFNQNNQEHYYLLWEVAGKGKKISFQEKIRKAYLSKFPEGIYKNDMK